LTRFARRLLCSLALVAAYAVPAAAVTKDSSIFGHLSIRYWLSQNILGVEQTTGTQQARELRRFNYGMVEVASSYWFGSLRQEQLQNLGALFGVGFSFGFGGFSLTVPNSDPVDVNTHWLNFDLLKFRILGDPEGPAHLIATANYTNFQNGAVQLSNFAGLGLGLEGKTAVGPWGDLFFKASVVPLPLSAGTSGLAMVELGSRWHVAPNVSLNLGYKGMFSGVIVDRTGTVTGSTDPVNVRVALWDVFHGPVIGTTFVF
jgi:hypothetical protein